MSNDVATLANLIQFSSDVLVEVIGPDVAHEINGEKINPVSLKSLIKAELIASGVVGAVADV